MAQKVEVHLVDDIDGTTTAAENLSFALEGRYYEIDLSTENAKALKDALKPYIKAGRPVAPPSPKAEAKQIREWAKKNGYQISDRGRVHHNIVEAYRNAGKKK